jgi:hypothetical protein
MCCTFPSCLVLLICDMQDCCQRPQLAEELRGEEARQNRPNVAVRRNAQQTGMPASRQMTASTRPAAPSGSNEKAESQVG